MKRVILHIGAHKTGTSTIQAWLFQHHEFLLRQGISVPVDFGKPGNNPVQLIKAICADAADRKPSEEKLVNRFSDWIGAQGDRDVIVSAELMGNALVQSTKANNLIQFFQARAESVLVIYFIRNPIDFVNSNYNQIRKMLRMVQFDSSVGALQKGTHGPNWSLILDTVKSLGCDYRLGVYPPEHGSDDLIPQFLKLVGLDESELPKQVLKQEAQNASLGKLGFFAATHLMECYVHLPFEERIAISGILKSVVKPLEEPPIRLFSDADLDSFQPAVKAKLAEIQPEITPRELERLSECRSARYARLPTSHEALTEDDRTTLDKVLRQVAERIDKNENLRASGVTGQAIFERPWTADVLRPDVQQHEVMGVSHQMPLD